MAGELVPITVTARRLLPDGSVDPCADPLYANTDYCRTREPNETPAQWAARRALEISIRDGNRPAVAGIPGYVWALLGVVALLLLGPK